MGAEFGFGGGGVDARFGVGRDDGGSMKLAAMEVAMKKTAVVRPRLPATVLPPVTSHTYITSGEAPHFIRRSFTCQFVLAPFGSVPCSTIQNLFGIHVEGEEFLIGGVGIEASVQPLNRGAEVLPLSHMPNDQPLPTFAFVFDVSRRAFHMRQDSCKITTLAQDVTTDSQVPSA